MDYGKTLPITGAGVVLGGVVIDQIWLVAISAGLLLGGVALIRLGFRRGKTPEDV